MAERSSRRGEPITALIPHDDGGSPGTWFMSDGQPVHCCSACGKAGMLRDHAVMGNGVVRNIGCFPPCRRVTHYAILKDWTYGAKLAGRRVR